MNDEELTKVTDISHIEGAALSMLARLGIDTTKSSVRKVVLTVEVGELPMVDVQFHMMNNTTKMYDAINESYTLVKKDKISPITVDVKVDSSMVMPIVADCFDDLANQIKDAATKYRKEAE